MKNISYELPNMKHPKVNGLVSIIVPIYNNETHLGECLNSILAQTFTNWEAVLVNDGSTDNTAKIIDEYAEKDPRFIAVHKQNEGTLCARKTGLENSRGEFIANIDHDDTYHPRFLEKMLAKITETNADFVWCECQLNNEKEKTGLASYHVTNYKWSVDASENVAITLTLGQGVSLLTWDKLIKRDVYAKVLFPSGHFVLGEDPLQIVQVAYHSKSAAFVAENIYFHRLGGFSSDNTKPADIAAWIRFSVTLYEIIENLFEKNVPANVRDKFCYFMSWHNVAAYFFSLDKKQRREYKDKLKPFLPKCIKFEKRFIMRTALFLANAEITFPFYAGKFVKKIGRKIKSILCFHKG